MTRRLQGGKEDAAVGWTDGHIEVFGSGKWLHSLAACSRRTSLLQILLHLRAFGKHVPVVGGGGLHLGKQLHSHAERELQDDQYGSRLQLGEQVPVTKEDLEDL